jgi:hypothetical protein
MVCRGSFSLFSDGERTDMIGSAAMRVKHHQSVTEDKLAMIVTKSIFDTRAPLLLFFKNRNFWITKK